MIVSACIVGVLEVNTTAVHIISKRPTSAPLSSLIWCWDTAMIAFIPNLSFMVKFLTFQRCQRRKLTLGIKPSLSTAASSKLFRVLGRQREGNFNAHPGNWFLKFTCSPPPSIFQIDLLSSSCQEPASPLVSKNQV